MIQMKHWCDVIFDKPFLFCKVNSFNTYRHMKSYMIPVLKILMGRSYNIRINDTEVTEYQVNFSGISSTEW